MDGGCEDRLGCVPDGVSKVDEVAQASLVLDKGI